jgi:hypothetical protein
MTPEQRRYHKRYREEHRVQINARARAARAAHPRRFRAYWRKWAKKHYKRLRKKIVARGRRWRKENPIRVALQAARRRAKLAGVPFNLRPQDVSVPSRCPVLGTRMVGPQLDRINPQRGYVRGNVAVISKRANRLKSDATLKELEAIVAYVRQAEDLRE